MTKQGKSFHHAIYFGPLFFLSSCILAKSTARQGVP